MRRRVVRSLLLALAGCTTLSLLYAQDRKPVAPALQPVPPGQPDPTSKGPAPVVAAPAVAAPPALDLSRLKPLQKQMFISARRGADWLYRMNGVKGRFLYGYLPALMAEMEGDHYLHQAGAAFALARAARVTGEERYAARATQAILALLDETVTEPGDAQVRHTALPSAAVNRLGAAGLLVLAINELPAPQPDLLEKSEQLCRYIRSQARAEGSLGCSGDPASQPGGDDPEAVNCYPGVALYALALSQKHRPASWKTEVLRKAVAFYRPWWQAHKSMALVPWQSAAYAEAFLSTRDQAFADCVYEMNDWLCRLRYAQIDPRRMLWWGGFMSWTDGHAVESAPQADSAACAEGLAAACRVAREAGDVTHYERYTEALERCLQFLVTLQYTDANTQHFADWYRPRLVGAFHASHQDGNLRIDYTQHAVSAMLQYLEQVVR